MKNNNKDQEIRKTAEELYLQNGYHATSMREISARSGIGLGLITYYYKSKFELAKACLCEHFNVIEKMVSDAVDFEENPLLYHATYLRLSNIYFMRENLRKFYYECLEEGIYESYIFNTIPSTLRKLNVLYDAGLSEDYILLYGNYLPADMEKRIVLQKKEGNFSSISEEEIPAIVFRTGVSMFVHDNLLLEDTIQKSISLCEVLKKNLI